MNKSSWFVFLTLQPFYMYRDRFRTVVNVWGDSLGAAIVEHLSRKELLAVDYEHERLHSPDDRGEGHEMNEATPVENVTDELTYM